MDEVEPPGSPGAPGSTPHAPSPWQLAGLGAQFLVALLLGVGGGAWLDRRLGSAPLGVLGGLVLAGAVFVRLVRPFLRNGARGPGGGTSA